MKQRFFLILLLVFLSLPSLVFADVIVSGPISSDTTWSPSNGVYIIDSSFSVSAGATLTIEPGTIIKAKSTWYGGPSIYGKIIANGTNELPIYFTSFWNDNIGGDTDGYPSGTVDNRWQGLYFKEGSEGDFDYVDISYSGYGGYGYGNFVGIENDGGTVRIKHSYIHDNYKIVSNGAGGSVSAGSGIYNKSGTLSITNSIIENNTVGIRIDSGNATISNNEIKNNVDSTGYGSGYGISAYGSGQLNLLNNNFSGNDRTAIIEASREFIHSGNNSSDLTRKAFQISGLLSQNLTLSGDDLPYIIEYLTVPEGITLTLEPGVIIKMEDRYTNGSISVQGGNLVAKGTSEKKIYITSLKDDSVGGDTNGDGDLTTPAPRSWASIFLENNSNAEFDYVTLGYGGYNWNGEYMNVAAAIYQRGAEFSIANSLFRYNHGAAIYQDAGVTMIIKSEFVGDHGLWSRGGAAAISESSLEMTGYGIYNESGKDIGWWWETRPLQIIDARDNWWGSADGPNDTYINTPTGSGTMVSDNVLYAPFLGVWPPAVMDDSIINPVIIIPGIMGSAKKNGELLIDPILHTYDDLIATLIENGYEEGKDLFTFPYEWRDSNIITANLLKDKINQVKQTCLVLNLPDTNCNKVDLVAHSMGGLVAREYIQSGQYQNDVDQLIFLGTPHKGSPTDYLQWEAGKFPTDVYGTFNELFFEAEALRNGYLTIFDYIHNRPILSVRELLPTFDYLKDKNTEVLRAYPDNYPVNSFLENLNNNIFALLNSGVKIVNIVGDSGENKTIEKIRVIPTDHAKFWQHGEPEGFGALIGDNGLERSRGDNTVTLYGATLDNSIANEGSVGSHRRIPTVEANKIFNILTNKISTTNIDNGFNLSPKILLLQLLSPIDVVVTDPNGKKMGKNFQTGEEYNEIPNAFYSGFKNGDDEYITIPNPLDGEYKIELQGTGNGGKYGVLTSYISDTFATTTETTGVTKPNQITELNTIVDNTNPDKLETERKITPEVLINDINGSYDLGWIKDAKTRDALVKQVNGAIKFNKKIDIIKERQKDGSIKEKRVERFEIKVSKILTQLFTLELKALLKKKTITQEAYDLIKNDIEYLINN